jgi:hypothetical protein
MAVVDLPRPAAGLAAAHLHLRRSLLALRDDRSSSIVKALRMLFAEFSDRLVLCGANAVAREREGHAALMRDSRTMDATSEFVQKW